MVKSKTELKEKLYACKVCGHEKRITTNHFGECYSSGNINTCPTCPPFKRPNTWVCKEQEQDFNFSESDFNLRKLKLRTFGK